MSVLNFKEIPKAHIASGLQDTFELFARDFLDFMGYKIVSDPDRGADGGKDIIVEESRTGVGGETIIQWLVSCKHKAHSGNSVTPTDESNIRDRVEANNCKGFIGFYSTLASSGLSNNLEGLNTKIETQLFDREKIERNILHSAKGLEIAERYFPSSLSDWRTENPEPAKIFIDNPTLTCKICEKELFGQVDKGVVTVWSKVREDFSKPEEIEHIFWTCRGRCDQILSHHIGESASDLIDGWEDISDVMMPTVFIRWIMSTLNEQKNGVKYSEESFENLKHFMLQVFPFVSRNLTAKERERIKSLSMIPDYLGGLNFGD